MKDLATYRRKRHFRDTPEPRGSKRQTRKQKALSFVVQRHDASHLHYDFRLEVDGVLKSWAVPKGPSMNPADKRLAVQVEDHPLTYGKFEGVIPEGNYGAGTVEIWDHGTYEPETADTVDPQRKIGEDLARGSLKFILHGDKLEGSFALVRMKDGKNKNWLLIKHRDASARNGQPESVPPPLPDGEMEQVRSVRSSKGEKLTHFIKPMLATLHDNAFDDPDWIFEIKWDGYRAIAEVGEKTVKFYSRNGLSFTGMYPTIVRELKKLKASAVLDGEVVVLDDQGRSSFQRLQQYGDHPTWPIAYYIFDCLCYDGEDLTALPLIERKKYLSRVLPDSDILKISDHVAQSGTEFFSEIRKMDLEGMIAKRGSSSYEKGKRTKDWLKVKNHNTQEAIIAGFTKPKGGRHYFGALVLALRSGRKLTYIGHTGTGFTEAILEDLYGKLKPLIRDTSPFGEKIPVRGNVTWVEPRLVCEVKFAEITRGGILRQAVFQGLRIDKPAAETNHLDAVESREPPEDKPVLKAGRGGLYKVDGHSLKLSHLDKVYWPKEKITKGDLIRYYLEVGPYLLPFLKDRPQSLKRNPAGISGKGFFQKDAAGDAPAWVEHELIYSDSTGKDVDYIVCNDQATLTYMNNLGCIEINPWNSRTGHLDRPDYLVLDLDPAAENSFDQVVDAALAVKSVLDEAGIHSCCKTSGASGIHIYIPFHAAYTYDELRPFGELVATLAQSRVPSITTIERSLSARKGRIYLDYLQNSRGQTLASVYSVRPVEGATVSTPLDWKEVKHGLHPSKFTICTMAGRLKKNSELFAPVLHERTDLRKCIAALEKLSR